MQAAFEEAKASEEAQQAQQARLIESEAQHRTIFETVPDGIALTNLQGIITYASPAALTLLGLDGPDEAAGTSIFDWIAPASRDGIRARVAGFIASGSRPAVASVFPLVRKDGTPFFAEISSAVLFDAAKKPRGMISVLRDVSDRITRQEALARATAKLNLLSAVTRHDIQNQITVLMGYVELARQADEPGAAREFLDKIDDIADTLGQHIEFTKNYQDLGVRSPQWQSLAMVCSHVISQLDMGEVKVVDESRNLELYADPLFEKVVYNIIDNSLRYGGGISTIQVGCWHEGEVLTWSINDDGAGIPVGDKSRIFNKGFGKNTGLGLFLAREILAITGMCIKETGNPGSGARFEIMVPAGMFRFSSIGPLCGTGPGN